jgi:hypothetical protein
VFLFFSFFPRSSEHCKGSWPPGFSSRGSFYTYYFPAIYMLCVSFYIGLKIKGGDIIHCDVI